MTLRRLAAGTVALALLAACRSAPARSSSSTAAPPDPDRWDRALCGLGAYPEALDAAALARARQDDLEAAWNGLSRPSAWMELVRERAEFDARCAAWRLPSATATLEGLRATTERSRTLRQWDTARDRLGGDAAADARAQ